jgi:PAS domain S-box-containing protein
MSGKKSLCRDDKQILHQHYYALLQAAPFPIFVADVETGQIIEANEAAEALRSQPREEILGIHQSELHPQDNAEQYRKLFDRHFRDGGTKRTLPDGSQIHVVDATGTKIPVEISVNPVTIADQPVMYGVFRPLVDRQERKLDLNTFRKAVENAGHSIYFTDVEGTIEYVNPAFEEVTGYTSEEAIGKTPSILKSGEMSTDFYEELWETILAGEMFQAEVINERADGEHFVVHQTIAPVRDETGDIVRFVAVNSDISDLRHREQELEAERDRAQQLRQRLSVLNRIMRHDLRSAVNIIKANADLIQSGNSPDHEPLETIERHADKIHQYSEDIRILEETLEEKGETPLVECELSSLLVRHVSKMRERHPTVSIETRLPDEMWVRAHDRLGRAIEHLLQNGIEHNDSDQVRLEVVVEADSTEDGWMELCIADNGPGIPEGELVSLGETTETALEHMSGLGLWLVYWVVQQSDGDLTFSDNAPRGTVVRIRLPSASHTNDP